MKVNLIENDTCETRVQGIVDHNVTGEAVVNMVYERDQGTDISKKEYQLDINFLTPLMGCYQCGKSKCLTCNYIEHKASSFMSNNTQESFFIKQFINCSTSYVVYLLTCPCGLQYVGRTTRALRCRFLEHRRAIIKNNPTHNIAAHFKKYHHSNVALLKLKGIEHIKFTPRGGDRYRRLCIRESYWIHILSTLSQDGFNEALDLDFGT